MNYSKSMRIITFSLLSFSAPTTAAAAAASSSSWTTVVRLLTFTQLLLLMMTTTCNASAVLNQTMSTTTTPPQQQQPPLAATTLTNRSHLNNNHNSRIKSASAVASGNFSSFIDGAGTDKQIPLVRLPSNTLLKYTAYKDVSILHFRIPADTRTALFTFKAYEESKSAFSK